MNLFRKAWNWLLGMERAVMVLSSIMVVGLVFSTVVMRYIFKISFRGMEEIVIFFAFWIYFIGGAYGSYEESQITADVISILIKKKEALLSIKVVKGAIETVIMGISAVLAVFMMQHAFATGQRTIAVKIPYTLVYLPILLGLALMTFYSAYHTVRYAGELLRCRKRRDEI